MTIKEYGGQAGSPTMEIYGFANENKPIGTYNGLKIYEGSVFVEIDTGSIYIYSDSTDKWYQF